MAEAAVHARRTGGVAAPGLPSWGGTAFRVVVSIAVTLFGLMALTFFIGRMLPLDPVTAILGDNATQEAIDAMRVQLGLDQPIWIQFGRYVGDILRLDLGTALTTGRPVLTDIARVFPATIELAPDWAFRSASWRPPIVTRRWIISSASSACSAIRPPTSGWG
jgi:peptide/nickel transport system permease protein